MAKGNRPCAAISSRVEHGLGFLARHPHQYQVVGLPLHQRSDLNALVTGLQIAFPCPGTAGSPALAGHLLTVALSTDTYPVFGQAAPRRAMAPIKRSHKLVQAPTLPPATPHQRPWCISATDALYPQDSCQPRS